MTEADRKNVKSSSLPARVVGVLICLVGAILFAGGVWLAALGGSLYYALAGAGLVGAGYYLFRGRSLGAWLYVAIFTLTVPWAFWESGTNHWALVPRLVGPVILLALAALVSPFLVPKTSWSKALIGAAASVTFLVAALLGTSLARPDAVKSDLLSAAPYCDPFFGLALPIRLENGLLERNKRP